MSFITTTADKTREIVSWLQKNLGLLAIGVIKCDGQFCNVFTTFVPV